MIAVPVLDPVQDAGQHRGGIGGFHLDLDRAADHVRVHRLLDQHAGTGLCLPRQHAVPPIGRVALGLAADPGDQMADQAVMQEVVAQRCGGQRLGLGPGGLDRGFDDGARRQQIGGDVDGRVGSSRFRRQAKQTPHCSIIDRNQRCSSVV